MSYPTTSSTSPPPHSTSSSSSSFRSRLAGIPTTTRSRPLTFPLGSLLGFLVGLSAASLWGYTSLISSHRALNEQTQRTLTELEETTRRVQHDLVYTVGRMGVSVDQLEEVKGKMGRRIEGLEDTCRRQEVDRERVERRVIGLEEENLDLRRRLWKMGKYAKPLGQKSSSPQAQQQQQQQQQRPYGALLWTGQSQQGQRLV